MIISSNFWCKLESSSSAISIDPSLNVCSRVGAVESQASVPADSSDKSRVLFIFPPWVKTRLYITFSASSLLSISSLDSSSSSFIALRNLYNLSSISGGIFSSFRETDSIPVSAAFMSKEISSKSKCFFRINDVACCIRSFWAKSPNGRKEREETNAYAIFCRSGCSSRNATDNISSRLSTLPSSFCKVLVM